MEKTIIKWQTVNTRKKNKNYPEVGRIIVYKLKYKFADLGKNEQIMTSVVRDGISHPNVDDGPYGGSILNGFQWCYLEDIENIQE